MFSVLVFWFAARCLIDLVCFSLIHFFFWQDMKTIPFLLGGGAIAMDFLCSDLKKLHLRARKSGEEVQFIFQKRGIVEPLTRAELLVFYQKMIDDMRQGNPIYYDESLLRGNNVGAVIDLDIDHVEDNPATLRMIWIMARLLWKVARVTLPTVQSLRVLVCLAWPPMEFVVQDGKVTAVRKEMLFGQNVCLADELLPIDEISGELDGEQLLREPDMSPFAEFDATAMARGNPSAKKRPPLPAPTVIKAGAHLYLPGVFLLREDLWRLNVLFRKQLELFFGPRPDGCNPWSRVVDAKLSSLRMLGSNKFDDCVYCNAKSCHVCRMTGRIDFGKPYFPVAFVNADGKLEPLQGLAMRWLEMFELTRLSYYPEDDAVHVLQVPSEWLDDDLQTRLVAIEHSNGQAVTRVKHPKSGEMGKRVKVRIDDVHQRLTLATAFTEWASNPLNGERLWRDIQVQHVDFLDLDPKAWVALVIIRKFPRVDMFCRRQKEAHAKSSIFFILKKKELVEDNRFSQYCKACEAPPGVCYDTSNRLEIRFSEVCNQLQLRFPLPALQEDSKETKAESAADDGTEPLVFPNDWCDNSSVVAVASFPALVKPMAQPRLEGTPGNIFSPKGSLDPPRKLQRDEFQGDGALIADMNAPNSKRIMKRPRGNNELKQFWGK